MDDQHGDRKEGGNRADEEIFPDDYEFYDDFPAINVDEIVDIPSDYKKEMGVPITVLDKVQNGFKLFFNGNEYEILGMMNNGKGEYDLAQPRIGDKVKYKRIVIKMKGPAS